MARVIHWACIGVAASALAVGCYKFQSSQGGGKVSERAVEKAKQRPPSPYDVEVPPGYRVELVADKLNFPTGVAFGPRDEIFVTESGYVYGEVFTKPRLVAIENGAARELATGDGEPWTGLAYHDGAIFVVHGGVKTGGRVVRYDLDGNRVAKQTVLVDKLPSVGDHHTNGPAISRDDHVYFGIGVATNSAVVGIDSHDFGWLERNP